MPDGLSIFAAARDAGDAIALRLPGRAYGFGELADRVRVRLDELKLDSGGAALVPLVGANTFDAVITVYALLEARVPVLLLHPRQAEPERQAVLAAAQRSAAALPADAAAVIYTSGTTGEPRGAVLTRAALLASAQASAANMGWEPDDCWMLAMPLARVGGLSILTRCLAARRTVALVPAFDAQRLPQWVDEQRATLLSLVPTMLAQCLDAHPDWTAPPHLRAIQLGGAAASPALLQRAAQRGLPIVVTYGCTETSSQVVSTPYAMRYQAASCGAGRPLANVQLRIEGGQIQVRGPMRMAGYLGEPPLAPDAWFDTGDLGELDAQGFLHVYARRADLIVTGGENVYPAEVERVLERCPGIVAAGVFGVADETWGQLVAAALVAAAQPPDDRAILEHLAANVAPYKRPRLVAFVDALPHNSAGKLDRRSLGEMLCALRPLRLPVDQRG